MDTARGSIKEVELAYRRLPITAESLLDVSAFTRNSSLLYTVDDGSLTP
jgi:hypothetical protein